MMCRKRNFAFALVITLMCIGMMVQAEAAGGPVLPGQPPLSKIVVTGSSVRDPDLFIGSKPITMGKEVVMSGPSQSVPQEAYDIWLKSKNIFDAAIPLATLTACLGGQWMPGTAMPAIWDAKNHAYSTYSGNGTAQALMTLDFVRNVLKLQYPSEQGDTILGVPNAGSWIQSNLIPMPDMLIAVLDRFGTMSWTQAMAGVYEKFQYGIPATASVASSARSQYTNKNRMSLPIYAEQRALDTQGGPNMKEGYLYLRRGAARFVKEMSNAEQAALAGGATRSAALWAARDEFYLGGFAKAIDQFSKDTGGFTRYSDYAVYQGIWYEQNSLDVAHTKFMGVDFYGDSPIGQGITSLMTLNMISLAKEVTGKTLIEMGYGTTEYIHFILACFDLAFADRWYYVGGDPQFVSCPAHELLSMEYAKERVKLIDMNKRFGPLPPPPGDPRTLKNVLPGWKPWTLPPKIAGAPAQNQDLAMIVDETVTDTTHGAIMDAAGNIFSITPSDSGPFVPGYGIGIAARSRQFTYDPALPSCLVPGKRPPTTPSVVLGVKDGEGYMETGTVSGDSQPQAHVQLILNYLVWGMNPQVAVDQPRFYTSNYYSWFTPHITANAPSSTTTLARGAPSQMYTSLGVKDYPSKAVMDGLAAKLDQAGKPTVVTLSSWAGAGSPTFTVRDIDTHILYAGSQGFAQQNMYSYGK